MKRQTRYWKTNKDITKSFYDKEVLKAFRKASLFKKISDKRRLRRRTIKINKSWKKRLEETSMKFRI